MAKTAKNETPKNPAGKGVGPAKNALKKTVAKKNGLKKQSARKAPTKARTKGIDARPAPPMPATEGVLHRLHGVIMDRRFADPAHSHSARLLLRGTAKVAQKFGEEAVECLIEAVAGNNKALVSESADVLYHLLVMWAAAGIDPVDVWAELERREGVSGIAEKAARSGGARPGASKPAVTKSGATKSGAATLGTSKIP